MNLEAFILLAFLLEALVNILLKVYVPVEGKPFWQCIDGKLLLSIGVGQLLAFGFRMNLMSVLGYAAEPWLGMMLTGLLLSRGSNFIHDLTQFAKNLQQATTETATERVARLARRTKPIQPQPTQPRTNIPTG